MIGTLEYMAPECLLKEPGSPASDVYAWAVTVNELATGTFPFSDCTRDNPKAHTVLDMGYGRSARLPDACSSVQKAHQDTSCTSAGIDRTSRSSSPVLEALNHDNRSEL